MKYDRQILAIAKVNGATTIYSDDGYIRTLAKRVKINVVSLADLPLPPQKAQLDLQLTAPTRNVAGNKKMTECPILGKVVGDRLADFAEAFAQKLREDPARCFPRNQEQAMGSGH